jgi:hypothetical protein
MICSCSFCARFLFFFFLYMHAGFLRGVFYVYFPRDVTTSAMKRIKAEGPFTHLVFCLMGKETQADRVPITAMYTIPMHAGAADRSLHVYDYQNCKKNKQKQGCLCYVMYVRAVDDMPPFSTENWDQSPF